MVRAVSRGEHLCKSLVERQWPSVEWTSSGSVSKPRDHLSRFLNFFAIHGGPTGLYFIARDSDAGLHIVFRVDP